MKKMLIVENDELSVKILARIFRKDFEIFHCASSEEYYETYDTIIFDIILMDISINGKKSGLELTREIKASLSYKGTPIIGLTAHAQNKVKLEAIEAGMDHILIKPVSNEELKEAIRSLIESRQQKQIKII